jgi:hypothetical protein
MDEICDAAKAPRPALRPSVTPHKSRRCKAGKKCLKFGTAEKRKPAPRLRHGLNTVQRIVGSPTLFEGSGLGCWRLSKTIQKWA